MFYTIYQITNKETGKIYIGKHQTSNLDDGYMGSGILVKRAQEKHGLEAFTKEILHVFNNEEEMNRKEAELVNEEFCSRDDTYNLCPGGKGGWGYVNMIGDRIKGHTEEMYVKVSEALKNKSHEVHNRPNRIIAVQKAHCAGKMKYDNFRGKTHSEETKHKISESNSIKQSGKNNSQFGLQWITNGVESKKIKKHDPIPEGWKKGRKMK